MLERGPAREPPHRVQLSVGSVPTWADFPSRGPRWHRTPARRSWPSSRPLRGVTARSEPRPHPSRSGIPWLSCVRPVGHWAFNPPDPNHAPRRRAVGPSALSRGRRHTVLPSHRRTDTLESRVTAPWPCGGLHRAPCDRSLLFPSGCRVLRPLGLVSRCCWWRRCESEGGEVVRLGQGLFEVV